jgi:hypothetical protein
MRQRPPGAGVMPGFWEVPYAEGARLGPDCLDPLGIELAEQVGNFRHGIMFRSYIGAVYLARLSGRKPEEYRWLTAAERDALPVSTITRKALAAAKIAKS